MSKKPFSEDEKRQLAYIAALDDANIDIDDIPEAPAENWALAQRPGLYRPVKQSMTIRLDADVLGWFKNHAQGGGYQTDINRVLRQHVVAAEKGSA